MTTTKEKHGMEQLELGFDAASTAAGPGCGEGRLARAAWWFGQMHRVVSSALDWRPAPALRPQQGWLPPFSRELRLG